MVQCIRHLFNKLLFFCEWEETLTNYFVSQNIRKINFKIKLQIIIYHGHTATPT